MMRRLLCIVALSHALAAYGAENFIPVPTELRVSSVSVSIRAPLGLRYRPGEMFPLEILVDNPHQAMSAELSAGESGASSGEWAERAVLPGPVTLAPGKSRFVLPMRAPGVSASVVLTLRGGEGGGKAELFRASLSRILHPLPSGGRVILVCGGGAARYDPQDETVQLSARELPAEGWMWESVDWVVLNDASIKEAPAAAREGLRRWLEGGGRLFLGTREAFGAAVGARLLPLDSKSDIGSDVKWWEQNAGLKAEDVLASKNFRPVFARVRLGFGQVVFLFPGSDADGVDGAAVFNRPDLQRARPALPDARIQPDRFGAFVPALPSSHRRGAVMLWSAIGALILCAALVYAHTSRSRLEAAILPLGAGALLAALIANAFPRPELLVSRVRWERMAGGQVLVQEEWALLESFRAPLETRARGPAQGTLAPRFDDVDDLRAAGLERLGEDGRLALRNIAVTANQPAMLYSRLDGAAERGASSGAGRLLAISARHDAPRVVPEALAGIDARHAIWICANHETWLLNKTAGEEVYGAQTYTPQALEALLAQESDAGSAKAHTAALKWAVAEALGWGGDAVVFWSESAGKEGALIEIEGASPGAGTEFLVRSVDTLRP